MTVITPERKDPSWAFEQYASLVRHRELAALQDYADDQYADDQPTDTEDEDGEEEQSEFSADDEADGAPPQWLPRTPPQRMPPENRDSKTVMDEKRTVEQACSYAELVTERAERLQAELSRARRATDPDDDLADADAWAQRFRKAAEDLEQVDMAEPSSTLAFATAGEDLLERARQAAAVARDAEARCRATATELSAGSRAEASAEADGGSDEMQDANVRAMIEALAGVSMGGTGLVEDASKDED